MIKITLTDGSVREYENEVTASDVCKDISMGLFRNACACRINGAVHDLRDTIDCDCSLEILTFDDDDGKKAFRHTASHVLAEAVLHLFPEAKLAIGPAIDDGFYYDFDTPTPIANSDLEKIEVEMKKIIKENHEITRFYLTPDEACKWAVEQNQPYKVLLVKKHAQKNEPISFYSQGGFTDLCAGPHLMDMSKIKAIRLTQVTGAYWQGDATSKQLSRVYGTCFPKASELEAHLTMLEEAKKRDHNKIGRDLEYFTTADIIGQGLPIMLPNGARAIQILQRFVEDTEQRHGWKLTKTPLMAKSDLYKLSGHWDHYQDSMFIMGEEGKNKEVFALRPMTCPFQYQAYLNRSRSYKDLPLRYNETSTLFRNEASGEMHGLIRVRQFTISEGHLMCTPEQLESEFKSCLDLAVYMLKSVGLYEDVSYRFSQWDPNDTKKYIGTKKDWDEAQGTMKKILDDLGIKYKVGIGEAAFYGPKLDIQIKNVHGKEDTLITIQIDQFLAEKFGMEYTDSDNSKKNPYIIHRTSIGCYERTLALIIEKTAGALPFWMAPEQVRILPIGTDQNELCDRMRERMLDLGYRAETDTRNEKIGYKIREATLQKIPYMLVCGAKEQENGTVSVRTRKGEVLGTMTFDEFLAKINPESRPAPMEKA